MKEYVVSCFNELHEVFQKYTEEKMWAFRGHANPAWTLIPKAGRYPYSDVDDIKVLESWKRMAVEFIKLQPKNNWDWLSIAQHHGLATRLLDWTSNPLYAAFFALREEYDTDAIVYAINFKYKVDIEKNEPFSMSHIAKYYPSSFVSRISHQSGVFSIQPNPKKIIEEYDEDIEGLEKIIIMKEYRAKLIKELSFYGVNSLKLFPGLDGLSQFLNWTIESKEYWN